MGFKIQLFRISTKCYSSNNRKNDVGPNCDSTQDEKCKNYLRFLSNYELKWRGLDGYLVKKLSMTRCFTPEQNPFLWCTSTARLCKDLFDCTYIMCYSLDKRSFKIRDLFPKCLVVELQYYQDKYFDLMKIWNVSAN